MAAQLGRLLEDPHYLAQELVTEVRKSSFLFDFIRRAALDGLWYWDLDQREHEWMDDRFWLTLGYDPASKPHSPDAWQDLIFADDVPMVLANFEQHLADPNHPYDQVVRYRHADGSTVWVRCRGIALRDERGRPNRMLGAHVDVTRVEQARLALEHEYRILAQRSEEKAYELQQLIEGLPLLVWTCEPDGRCDYLSPQWVEYTGVPEAEQLDANWLEQLHPEDIPRIQGDWTRSVEQGVPLDIEFRIRHHEGEYRWFKTRANPLRDANGKVVKWFGTNTDIHAHRVAEDALRERTAALETSNAELERFAYVISHDLKAPLRGIRLAVGWLKEALDDNPSPDVVENMGFIDSRAERLSGLIDGVLDYSRAQRNALEREDFELGRVVREVITDLSAGASCRIEAEGPWPVVQGDRLRVGQVLRNLVDNALKFQDHEDGVIQIACVTAGAFHRISVQDDGPGIAAEHRTRIFELFTTLNPRDEIESKGVGLALCHTLVERWGGSIWVESAEPRGSVFRFTIPRTYG